MELQNYKSMIPLDRTQTLVDQRPVEMAGYFRSPNLVPHNFAALLATGLILHNLEALDTLDKLFDA